MESLNHSKYSLFRNCRRAFYYEREQRLQLKSGKPSLRRGSAWAHTLASISKEHGDELPDYTILTVAQDACNEFYQDYETTNEDVELERLLIPYLAVGYGYAHNRRPGLAYGDRREMEYKHPLWNPATGRASRTWFVNGRMDGVIELPMGLDTVLIIEDKLTEQIQSVDIEKLVIDQQCLEYIDAFHARGWSAIISYRFTRWPSKKPHKGEQAGQFVERMREDIADRPHFYFVEYTPLFPLEGMEQFREGRWQTAKDITQARRERTWYQNPGHCRMFGKCQFIPLCTLQPGAEDLYERRPERDHQG